MESIPEHPILKFNPSTLEEIRKLYNLENGRMEESVIILQKWMSKQNHLVKKFSPAYLEKTLIACKGSVEKAKSQIDKLCTMKTLLPNYFIGGNVLDNFGNFLDIAWVIPLPKPTKDHVRIVSIKINSKDFTAAHFMNYYQLVIIISEYIKAHDYLNGVIVINDYRDTNLLDIVTKISIVELQQFMAILIEGFGVRMLGLHILTQSKAVDLFIKTLKSMLSAKIAERVHAHHDFEELHDIVDKALLPVEYGGEERSLKTLKNEWLDILSSEENEKYLTEMKESCSDESLRGSAKYNEQIMGLPGSFRTLHVD